jgi:Glycine zipper
VWPGSVSRLRSLKSVAVVDVIGPLNAVQQVQVADFVLMELLKHGYQALERGQIQKVVKEIDFQNSGLTRRDAALKTGRMLNTPAVVIVNVPEWGGKMTMGVKVIEVETGAIMFMGDATGSTGAAASTLIGAAVGAAVGYGIGDSSSGRHGGTVIGGVVGGAAGYAFSSSQRKVVKKMIVVMFKNLPKKHW